MSLADTAEALLMEYSNYVDLYFNGKDRKRPLKCSFCNRSYKYQQVLNKHVNSQHMDKLKQISDQGRMEMINNFLLDDSKIMFPEFYRRYFTSSSSTTSTSGSRNPWILSLDNWSYISSLIYLFQQCQDPWNSPYESVLSNKVLWASFLDLRAGTQKQADSYFPP